MRRFGTHRSRQDAAGASAAGKRENPASRLASTGRNRAVHHAALVTLVLACIALVVSAVGWPDLSSDDVSEAAPAAVHDTTPPEQPMDVAFDYLSQHPSAIDQAVLERVQVEANRKAWFEEVARQQAAREAFLQEAAQQQAAQQQAAQRRQAAQERQRQSTDTSESSSASDSSSSASSSNSSSSSSSSSSTSGSGRCGGNLPPCCVMQRESGGNPNAVNESSGASGKWQFMPGTWDNYGGYPSAASAPESVQDAKAAQVWAGGAGASHWGGGC